MDAPGQRRGWALLGSLVFLVLAPGTVDVLIPWLLTGWRVGPPFPGGEALRMAGLLLIASGAIVVVESFLRFAWSGLGTPAPVFPTKHLVVSGCYRYVRNPMYVANVVIIFGQAVWFGSEAVLSYCVVVWLAFHVFVSFYEEPTMRATFGAEYDVYCKSVPRWIPRVTPAESA